MLELEPLLRARLSGMTELKGVHGLPEFSVQAMAGKLTPCAFVVFDGYRVLENTETGDAAHIATRWLVVIAVKNATQASDGQAIRADAVTVVNAVLARLMGWRAAPGLEPLSLAPAPRSDYEAGHLWLPLAFECKQVVHGIAM